jgi:DnaJ-domain-containing protein 1
MRVTRVTRRHPVQFGPTMTLPVPSTGEVHATALPRLLGDLGMAGATGTLLVEHDGGLSRAFFREGRPVGATVFTRFKPLGVFLMERGIIDFEALDRSLAEVARSRRPQGRILVELGVLTEEALQEGLQAQQASNLMNLLSLDSGQFRLETAEPPPPWTEDIRLDPLGVLRALFEQEAQIPRVGKLLEEMGDGRVRCRLPPETIAGLGLEPAARQLIETLLEPQPVIDAIAGAGLEARQAGAVVAAAWCLGWFETSSGAEVAAAPPAGPADAPVPEVSAQERGDEASPDVRARRSRLLRQAFRNIPGAERLGAAKAEAAAAPPADPPPAKTHQETSRPSREPGLSAEAQAMVREVVIVKKRMASDDFYKRLGIERRASLAEVKAAYLNLVKRYHPDRVAALALPKAAADDLHVVFEAIQEAYDTLRDPGARKGYDALLNDDRIRGDRQNVRKVAEAEINLKKGAGLVNAKDWAGALRCLEMARKVDPSNGRCEAYHAWARYNAGPKEKLKEEVRAQLVRATTLVGGKALGHYYLGILARMDGSLDKAERHFRQAVKADSKFTEAVSELRVVRRRMEKDNTTSTQRLLRKILGEKD